MFPAMYAPTRINKENKYSWILFLAPGYGCLKDMKLLLCSKISFYMSFLFIRINIGNSD